MALPGHDFVAAKESIQGIPWYPYGKLESTMWAIQELCGERFGELVKPGKSILDIGAADGELSFHLESLGCNVDALDNPSTNFNGCRAIRAIHEKIGSSLRLLERDVDFGFTLDRQYDLTVAFHILYHLRNPIDFLTTLALYSEHMALATRTIQRLPGHAQPITDLPIGYLYYAKEINNDATNYWVLSKEALRRCLARSGWHILNSFTVGAGEDADPIEHDQRTYVFCQRIPNYEDLRRVHP